MSSADDVWLCLLLVALFGLLFLLRVRFPNASRLSETAVLVSATIVFFSICGLFLHPHRLSPPPLRQAAHVQEGFRR